MAAGANSWSGRRRGSGCAGYRLIGDEGFSDASVGDGDDDALVEGSEEEVLLVWVPR